MKLRWLFAATQLLGMVAGILIFWQMKPDETGNWTGALAVAACVSIGFGAALATIITRGLGQLEATVADIDAPDASSVWSEFEQCLGRTRAVVQRWSQATAGGRQQIRQIEGLLESLDRRGDGPARERNGTPVEQLRGMLASLSGMADAELDQILTYAGDVDRATQEIASQTEDQSEAVSRTTTYVEQMSLQFDSVAEHANAAQRAADVARESATSAEKCVHELSRSIDGVRLRVQSAERRLRSLGERSQEIGSIVQTIGSISSRTDLLALNASIESFRAGEQGRGFSIVAEEVRKLAEQAALATREVSSLIESIQLETQESIQSMAEQRSEVDAEILRISETEQQLSRIASICSDSSGHVREIARLAGHQLHLTQDVVSAVERISEAARQNRSRAEGVGWTMKTVAKLTEKLKITLDPWHITGKEAASRQQQASHAKRSTSDVPRTSNRPELTDAGRADANEASAVAVMVGSDERA